MPTIDCPNCGFRILPHDAVCPDRETTTAGESSGPAPAPDPLIIYPAPDHGTVRNPDSETPMCKCGYDPGIDHPEASRSQLFAYVGQHIRAINDQAHARNAL